MTEFDPSVPNVARMYDYVLGGKTNFQADRDAADEIIAKSPEARIHARDNRAFLKRAVQWAAKYRVAQFIDIGSGLPTVQNTHEIGQAVNDNSRVAYVDYDPVAVQHAQVMMKRDHQVIALPGDLREPWEILDNPALRKFINLDQPVAVVLAAVLHFLRDPEAHEVVDYIKKAVAPGSCLIISHATADDADEDTIKTVQDTYDRTPSPLTMRTLDEVTRFFDGFELVGGPVVDVNAWWNAGAETRSTTVCYGGVAIKPEGSDM
jgi:O-methyltransferase involved in polyketide biosynthesis